MKYIHVRNGIFVTCASIGSTIEETSNRRLHKRRIDASAIIESTVILIILRKKIKIFRCPFSATVCSKQARFLKFTQLQRDSSPQPLIS